LHQNLAAVFKLYVIFLVNKKDENSCQGQRSRGKHHAR